MAININLKQLIQNKGYTIVKLSNEINITPANLSKLINNKVSEIKLKTLSKICDVLECTPGEILEYKNDIRKKIIPFFLDCVGGTDLILSSGVENIKNFFQYIIEFQKTTNIDLRIVIMTDVSLESARSKFKLFYDLAKNYGLPDLIYGVVLEHCGFFLNNQNKITQLSLLDTRIMEKRVDIEEIISEYNGKVNNQFVSMYNIVFKNISRSELAKVSEKINKVIDCKEIETVVFYDSYGIEIDIKNINNNKANAVLMLINEFNIEYDIPIIVMGGAPIKVNWEMYSKSKDILSQMDYKVIEVLANIEEADPVAEIDFSDINVVKLDLSNYKELMKLFNIIRSRINSTK